MFIELPHTRLDVFKVSKRFVLTCYGYSKTLPGDEKYVLSNQIRRAALSVHLNIAEGSARKSNQERARFYEMARSSLIEVDTAVDIAIELGYIAVYETVELEELTTRCFQMLTKMIEKHRQSGHIL